MKLFPIKANKHDKYKVAILIKEQAFNLHNITQFYFKHMKGIKKSDVICVGLPYQGKSVTAKYAKEFLLNNVYPLLDKFGTEVICVADAKYFGFITSKTATDIRYSYIKNNLPNSIYHNKWSVLPVTNYKQFIYDKGVKKRIKQELAHFDNALNNEVIDNRFKYISNFKYPESIKQIKIALKNLDGKDLTVDIEAFSLDHTKAGIATISFSTDKKNATAFYVDYMSYSCHKKHYNEFTPTKLQHGIRIENTVVKNLLKDFLMRNKAKYIFHNASFDAKQLVYELFMKKDSSNRKGLLEGFEHVYANYEDTQILCYLALNSTMQYFVDLKSNTIEFMGNYAVDVKDITTVKPEELREYNGSDTSATYYLYDKYKDIPTKFNQKYLYNNIFLPAARVLTNCELEGMGLDIKRVKKLKKKLEKKNNKLIDGLNNLPIIHTFLRQDSFNSWIKKLMKNKVKIPNINDYLQPFNYKSSQLSRFLFDFAKMPVLGVTKKGNASTDKKTMERLVETLKADKNNLVYCMVLEALNKIKLQGEMSTVITTFIPAFLKYSHKKSGMYYLMGNYKVPSTISGRPSSSKPNLLNIPSTGSPLKKPVKKCFKAPKGRCILGADYSSQEHKANALITKDPNMLAEYESGIDGHCLRAVKYFFKKFDSTFRKKLKYYESNKDKGSYYLDKDGLPTLKKTKKKISAQDFYVALINSVEILFPELRQDSKSPTFLLQFYGTYIGLMRQFNFSEKEAKFIEKAFHKMYSVSENWTKKRIKKAHKDGYVTGAFNLRLHTPILKQTVYDSEYTPHEAQQEARSAGNMISGQSYGLLTLRAFAGFMNRVKKAKKDMEIVPWAEIYDAIYIETPMTVDYIYWVNKNLIPEMENISGCPELEHPVVKMGATLCIYYPDWSVETKIPNGASKKEIKEILKKLEKDYA